MTDVQPKYDAKYYFTVEDSVKVVQDRVGPNRARLPIPGLSDRPLAGLPHIVADVLKMLFKEDFISDGAAKEKLLFNLGPLLSFGPAFNAQLRSITDRFTRRNGDVRPPIARVRKATFFHGWNL